jgi:hypothetical protein
MLEIARQIGVSLLAFGGLIVVASFLITLGDIARALRRIADAVAPEDES